MISDVSDGEASDERAKFACTFAVWGIIIRWSGLVKGLNLKSYAIASIAGSSHG